MAERKLARVLCVDDEPNLLEAVRRHLRRQFEVETAERGARALEMLRAGPPFAVVVSDLRMPEMDGVELLRRVGELYPDTTRIMLTGNAELSAAMRAVNDGHVFRFLTKPCSPDDLMAAVQSGVRVGQLAMNLREVHERTLPAIVDVLAEILSLANPAAFGRAKRVQRIVMGLAQSAGLEEPWRLEIASLLSQIGCIALPPELIEKVTRRSPLTPPEQRALAQHPETAARLLGRIPRLEEIAQAIRWQGATWEPTPGASGAPVGADIPRMARLLRLGLDLDQLESAGLTRAAAARQLAAGPKLYDPALIELALSCEPEPEALAECHLKIIDLRPGMVIVDDVRGGNNVLLVAAGQEVTTTLIERLVNWSRTYHASIREPFRVLVPAAGAAADEKPEAD